MVLLATPINLLELNIPPRLLASLRCHVKNLTASIGRDRNVDKSMSRACTSGFLIFCCQARDCYLARSEDQCSPTAITNAVILERRVAALRLALGNTVCQVVYTLISMLGSAADYLTLIVCAASGPVCTFLLAELSALSIQCHRRDAESGADSHYRGRRV